MVQILKLALTSWQAGITLILLLLPVCALISGIFRGLFNYLAVRRNGQERKAAAPPPMHWNCRCDMRAAGEERAGMDLPEDYPRPEGY